MRLALVKSVRHDCDRCITTTTNSARLQLLGRTAWEGRRLWAGEQRQGGERRGERESYERVKRDESAIIQPEQHDDEADWRTWKVGRTSALRRPARGGEASRHQALHDCQVRKLAIRRPWRSGRPRVAVSPPQTLPSDGLAGRTCSSRRPWSVTRQAQLLAVEERQATLKRKGSACPRRAYGVRNRTHVNVVPRSVVQKDIGPSVAAMISLSDMWGKTSRWCSAYLSRMSRRPAERSQSQQSLTRVGMRRDSDRTKEPVPPEPLPGLEKVDGTLQFDERSPVLRFSVHARLSKFAQSQAQLRQSPCVPFVFDRQKEPEVWLEGVVVRLELAVPGRALAACFGDVREEVAVGIEFVAQAPGQKGW